MTNADISIKGKAGLLSVLLSMKMIWIICSGFNTQDVNLTEHL